MTWLASWLSSWRSQRFVFKRRGGGEWAGEAPGISPEAFRSGFAAASALLTVGLENSLVSVPGAHLLGAGGTPLPSCGNQRRLQTWPSVPSLTKLSQAESHCPRLYFPITTIKNYRKLSSLKKKHRFLLLWLWRSEVQRSRCWQGSLLSRSSREDPRPRRPRLPEAAASGVFRATHLAPPNHPVWPRLPLSLLALGPSCPLLIRALEIALSAAGRPA